MSCERLRALLPRFAGRREDMASVLEMSVQFLRMAGTVVPGGEPQAVSVCGHRAALRGAAPTAPVQPGRVFPGSSPFVQMLPSSRLLWGRHCGSTSSSYVPSHGASMG